MVEQAEITLVLGSGSPRRREILAIAGYNFEVVVSDAEEIVDDSMSIYEVPKVLAIQKCNDLELSLPFETYVLITADTVVIHNEDIIGKPRDINHARSILKRLRNETHEVVSGVCIRSADGVVAFTDLTKVTFANYSDAEIEYYLNHYEVMDKAGAYAIQEWIGAIGINSIEGSYYNVMGLPIHKVHQHLKELGIRPLR